MPIFQGKFSVDTRRFKCGHRRSAGALAQHATRDDFSGILGKGKGNFLDPTRVDNAVIVRRTEERSANRANAGILSGRFADLVGAQVLHRNPVLGKFLQHGIHGARVGRMESTMAPGRIDPVAIARTLCRRTSLPRVGMTMLRSGQSAFPS